MGETSVLLASLAVYMASLQPSVAAGDSAELVSVAKDFGVAHPPGYPTLTVLGHATSLAASAAGGAKQLAHILNGVNAMIAALANASVFTTAKELAECAGLPHSAIAGSVAAGVFGINAVVWKYATHWEVFALNNLLCATLLQETVRFSTAETPSERLQWSRFGAFVAGLCLTNQHTSVLYVAPIAAWVLTHRGMLSAAGVGGVAAAGLAGLLPYLQLPLSAAWVASPSSWGDCSTLSGFAHHILRRDYGTFQLGSDSTAGAPSNVARSTLAAYAAHLLGDVGAVPVLFACVGGCALARRAGCGRAVVACWLVYLTVFVSLSNLDPTDPLFAGIVERFWAQPLIVVAVCAGAGACVCAEYVPCKAGHFHLACVGALLLSAAAQFSSVDQSGNMVTAAYGRALLTPLRPNTVFLAVGDSVMGAVRHASEVERIRPDVTVVHFPLLTYTWYVAAVRKLKGAPVKLPGQLYSDVPGASGAFNLLRLLQANPNTPFASNSPDLLQSLGEFTYVQRPGTGVMEIVPATEAEADDSAALRDYLAAHPDMSPEAQQWAAPPHPARFGQSSWEYGLLQSWWELRHARVDYLMKWHVRRRRTRGLGDVAGKEAVRAAAVAARHLAAAADDVEHFTKETLGVCRAHRNRMAAVRSLHRFFPEHSPDSVRSELRAALERVLRCEGIIPEEAARWRTELAELTGP